MTPSTLISTAFVVTGAGAVWADTDAAATVNAAARTGCVLDIDPEIDATGAAKEDRELQSVLFFGI